MPRPARDRSLAGCLGYSIGVALLVGGTLIVVGGTALLVKWIWGALL